MMSGKGKLRSSKRVSLFKFLLVTLALMPVTSFAQDLPCSGDDPYGNCPVDNYVWLLAIIAVIAGAIYLYRQQKAQSSI
jgi:hypothetical protein